jgi:hypothetical protein
MTRAAAIGVLLILVVGRPPGAEAGTNVWTDSFPHPTRWKSYKVTCKAQSDKCTHMAPPQVYHDGGLRYRTTTRVVRIRGAYEVQVEVEVSVTDGKRHGLIRKLSLGGTSSPFRTGSFGHGFTSIGMYMPTMPQISPGQRRLLRVSYPNKKTGHGAFSHYRLTLRVFVTGVTHYNPRHDLNPLVAKVVFVVPLRGSPRIHYAKPTP